MIVRVLTMVLISWWFAVATAVAESPKVPSTMTFAGMKLKLNDAARKEIQRDVDALHASRKYFDIKLDRVNLYFPIIERIFKEEKLPDDFKYLVIQESALISDAVSSANAVGFWQFKDFTGKEVGLRIDKLVDERLNIVSATQGAAKYLSRHNFYFDNWVYSLLAYNTGRGGAQRYVDKKLYGVSTMPIDQHTHWYVKKFLAHKVAFEKEIGGEHSQGLKLHEYQEGGGKSLDKIGKQFDVDVATLKQYNKWLYSNTIPTDKTYTVLIPTYHKLKETKSKPIDPANGPSEPEDLIAKGKNIYPEITDRLDGKVNQIIVKLNGIPAIMVQEGDNMEKLAAKAGISVKRLAKYNEISPEHKLMPGDFYYVKSKKKKVNLYYYTALAGESLWDISQRFGMKVGHLAKLNRMSIIDPPKQGQVLWLRQKKPADAPTVYEQVTPAPVQQETVKKEQPVAVVQQPKSEPVAKPKEEEKPKVEVEKEKMAPKEEETKPEKPEEKPIETPVEPEKKVEIVQLKDDSPVKSVPAIHEVASGETLYGIARKYGITIEQIKEWNSLTNFNLQPGQELHIQPNDSKAKAVASEKSPEKPKEEAITHHVVEPGDTLYSLSRKYNISVDRLLRINGKTDYNITVGEKIKVVE